MPKLGEIKQAKELGYKAKYDMIWSACPVCGKQRWIHLLRGKPVYELCNSCTRKGERHCNWKGGRKRDSKGYILVKIHPDDFFYPMANKDGRVREHRLVVAKAIGRCLLSWEIVHHKEGFAKDDNRYPETLELLPSQLKHDALTRMISYIRKLEAEIKLLKKDSRGVL